MAQTIKHAKVSAVPDGSDVNQVQPTDWNANHAITGTVDYSELSGKPSTFPPTLPIAESDVTNLVSDLALKAPLASPTFTGDPKAPTPATADNDTSIATTAHVHAAIAADVLKASTTEVLTGTDTAKTVTPDALAALWERGTDTAIAASLVLGEGAYFNLTGTGNITSISFQTPHSGRQAWLSFAFATLPVTLVNSANLILPGSADIVVAVGDQALVVDINGSAANTIRRVVSYMRLDGTTIPAGRASTTEVLTGTDTAKAVTPDALAALWEYSSVAGASATVVGEGGYFLITGAGPTTINSIVWATPHNGRGAWFLCGGINTLVHSTALKVPGAVSFVTANGDRFYAVSENATDTRIMVIQKADGTYLYGDATTTDVLTGTDTNKMVTPDSLAALWERGTDVASAATTIIGEGGYFSITGSVTITAFDFATVSRNGRFFSCRFTAALVLTNSATLILPGAANITAAIGDMATFVQSGTGSPDTFICLSYTCADGTVLAAATATTTEVLTGTNAAKLVTPDSLAALWEGGALASASNVNIGDGGFFFLSGTATINTFTFTTTHAGRRAWITATGACTLVHSANLIIPGFQNILLASGDCFEIIDEGGNGAVRVVSFRFSNVPPIGFGQVPFPATQVASAGANTLDDYEEGTFTPALTFGGAAVGMTLSTQFGQYTKIGRMVNYNIRIILTAKGTSTGAALITGLPFTAHSATNYVQSIWASQMSATVGDTMLTAIISATTTAVTPSKFVGGSSNGLTDADFTNTSAISVSGSYPV